MIGLRITGVFFVAFSAMGIGLVAINHGAAVHGGHDLAPILLPSLFILIIGVGLLFKQRLSAVVFAIGGLWQIVKAVWLFSPVNKFDVILGIIMFGVSIVVFRYWPSSSTN